MSRDRILAIARWEYVQKVRSKAFLLSLILFPLFIVGMSLLPSLLMNEEPSETQVIGLLDRSGIVAADIERAFESQGKIDDTTDAWEVRIYPDDDAGVEQGRVDALAEETIGFIEVVEEGGDSPRFYWRSTNLADVQRTSAVRSTIRQTMRQRALADAGLDSVTVAALNAPIEIVDVKLTEEGESESDSEIAFFVTFFSGFIGVMLFMILVITTGQTLVRGLVEEKSNRIMEILIGATRPSELMWGKLLGLSGLGLTQVLAWGVLGAIAAVAIGATPLSGTDALGDLLGSLPLVLLYLALGYVFFASIFIGVGSLVTTEQEAQMVTQYLSFVLAAPVAFAVAVLQNPNSGFIEAISYVPVVTPTVMMMRVVASDVSVGTILATTGILLLSTVLVTVAASRIFRTAILLYGKRPTVREIMRWLRD